MDASAARPLAVVTGASSGIGLQLAKVFAQEGFDLLITAEDAELAAAAHQLHAVLRPGGLLIATIRDYDAAQPSPGAAVPTELRLLGEGDSRRIVFQVWTWAADGRSYEVEQFILRPQGEGWLTTSARTRYRALKREELSQVLTTAGFQDVRWHMPETSGFYQPLITARRAP